MKFETTTPEFTRPDTWSAEFEGTFKGRGMFQVGADSLLKRIFAVVHISAAFVFVYRRYKSPITWQVTLPAHGSPHCSLRAPHIYLCLLFVK
jgi:lysylphosphatidylglycerol synthetase-like protein (DUF2156 family)